VHFCRLFYDTSASRSVVPKLGGYPQPLRRREGNLGGVTSRERNQSFLSNTSEIPSFLIGFSHPPQTPVRIINPNIKIFGSLDFSICRQFLSPIKEHRAAFSF
jgi:hypothetical protein